MILNLKDICDVVHKEGMEVCVISYGGSCSNQLVDVLEKNHYTCRTPSWNKLLCHCPERIELDIPIIYIYNDMRKSFLSMKRRGPNYFDMNQKKLSNNSETIISSENLIQLMIKQKHVWTDNYDPNVLVIHTQEIFTPEFENKIKVFLKNDNLKYFPIPFVKPSTKYNNITPEDNALFRKYQI